MVLYFMDSYNTNLLKAWYSSTPELDSWQRYSYNCSTCYWIENWIETGMLCLNTACTNLYATCQRFCLLFWLFNYFLCEFSTSRLEKFVWFRPLPLKGQLEYHLAYLSKKKEYHLAWMFMATWFYRDHFWTWISLKCSIGQVKKKALKSFTIKYSYKLLGKKANSHFD